MHSGAVILLVFSLVSFAVGVLVGIRIGRLRATAADIADRMRGFTYLGIVSQTRTVGVEDVRRAFDPYRGKQRDEVLREWERNGEQFTRRADDTPEGGEPRPVA